MRFVADADLQGMILEDIENLYLKRGELEAHLQNLDLINKLRNEQSALLETEAYRSHYLRPKLK